MSYDISNSKTRQRELAALFAAGAKFNCTDILLITDHESGDEKRGDLRFPRASRRSAIARSGTASRCVVYFMGNAPAVDAYASTPSTLVSYAKYGTKGWRANAPTARDLPERWPEENSYSRAMSTWTPATAAREFWHRVSDTNTA